MCVWVWPVGEGAAHPGVLREGLGEGAGPAALPGPGPRGWQVSGALGWEWREVAERPRSRQAEEIGRGGPRAGQRDGRAGPGPVKEQHLPPGVEMGRNGPEHRPGSENPRPLPWSGRRAGRKSLTLIPSPFPLPQRFPSPRPLPAPVFLLSRFGGWELCVTLAMVTPPTSRGGGAKGGPRGPDEGVTGGGVGEELKPTQAGKLRHDVMERNPYIPAPGRHLGLSRMEVSSRYVCMFSRVLSGFLAKGLRSWQLQSPQTR